MTWRKIVTCSSHIGDNRQTQNLKSDLSKFILMFKHNRVLRFCPDAAQKSSGLGLALGKFTFSEACDFLRMKMKNALESWWGVREECGCHKTPQSLNGRERPGNFGRPGGAEGCCRPHLLSLWWLPTKHQLHFHYLHFLPCLLLWFRPEKTMAKLQFSEPRKGWHPACFLPLSRSAQASLRQSWGGDI